MAQIGLGTCSKKCRIGQHIMCLSHIPPLAKRLDWPHPNQGRASGSSEFQGLLAGLIGLGDVLCLLCPQSRWCFPTSILRLVVTTNSWSKFLENLLFGMKSPLSQSQRITLGLSFTHDIGLVYLLQCSQVLSYL